ncbi:MAG: response regulator [Elusimicrobiota bacterium]
MKEHVVLIVDDNTNIREMIKIALKDFNNIKIYEANDGNTAFQIAQKHQPDLIYLDNKLPKMSGESVAKQLKTDPITKSITIVMMTGMKLTKSEIEYIKLEVDDYVEKPLSSWEIKNLAKKYIDGISEGMDVLGMDDLEDL